MRRPRALRERILHVRAAPELTYEVVASAGRTISQRSAHERVVEFATEVRGRRVVTREIVRLEPARAIHYEWIDGPLPFVEETIAIEPRADGSCELRYTGRYSTERGVLRCLVGMLYVRRMFDRAVAEHLSEARAISEARAARSKLYPRPGT